VIGAQPLPAERKTVLRFIGLFNNASTLRGALAAWRQIHIREHEAWPLEDDPLVRFLQTATKNLMAALPTRYALRRPLALEMIMLAHSKGGEWLQIGAIIALAYIYGLRVPSELLKQSTTTLWSITSRAVSYGPILRKHRPRPVSLTRSCICEEAPALCPHVWAGFIVSELPQAKSFSFSGAHFNNKFQQLHQELGSPDLPGWTSHAMRRGMALDVLEQHGLGAMLRAGDWHSTGAFAYASRDVVEQRLVGQMFAHCSDDDA
jgi:hypothetical protein